MQKPITLGAFAFVLAAVPVLAAEKPAELISIHIAKPQPKQRDWLMSFGNNATDLTFVVALEGRNIIGIDDAGCKLTTFTDDKKTDLMPKKESFGTHAAWIGAFPRMAP